MDIDEDVQSRDLKLEEWAKEDTPARKKYELKLMMKFDKTKINVAKECWYLVDTVWLNKWSEFVNTEDGEPPGPISNKDLLDENGNPLAGLKPRHDYRGLPPVAYFILKELHGSDGADDICRYSIDIYKPAVPPERKVNMQMIAYSEAKVQVNKSRVKWMTWEREYEEEEQFSHFWCCGLTKEHLAAFIYWAVHCWTWSRKSSGRSGISYRQYKPLRGLPDDSTHSSRSRHGSIGGGSRYGGSQHGSERSEHGSVGDRESTHNALHEGGMDGSRHSRSGEIETKGEEDEEDGADDSSSSDDELQAAPADVNHLKGQWWREITK